MKKILIYIAIQFYSTLNAQLKFEFNWSESFELTKKNMVPEPFAIENNQAYFSSIVDITNLYQQPEIQILDLSTQILTSKIPLQITVINDEYKNIILSDSIALIKFIRENEDNESQIYLYYFNNFGELITKRKLLESIKYKNRRQEGMISYRFNKTKNIFEIFSDIPGKSIELESFRYKTVNKNGEILKEKKIKLNFQNKLFDRYFTYYNDTIVCFLARTYINIKSNKKNYGENVLVIYDNIKDTLYSLDFNKSGKYLFNTVLVKNKNNLSFYSNYIDSISNKTGLVKLDYNLTSSKIINEVYSLFPDDVYEKLSKISKNKELGNILLKDYVLNSVNLLSDTICFYFEFVKSKQGNGFTNTAFDLNTKGIAIISFDSFGKYLFTKLINKNQLISVPMKLQNHNIFDNQKTIQTGSTLTFFDKKKQTSYFFNDHIDNLLLNEQNDLKQINTIDGGKYIGLYFAQLKSNGEIYKELLNTKLPEGYTIQVQNSYKKGNTIILTATNFKEKKYKIGVIYIKE